ncbi:HAD hydrolase, family IA [Brucella sp. 56/94]|nr:HAD hydrolase, family IA [Brucella sp. 56/94]
MAAPSLIIFDCDGVLVDSEIIAAEVESALLTESGYPIAADEMAERFAGLTWQDILLTVEREAGIPLSASLLDKSERILDEKLKNEVNAVEDIVEVVSALKLPKCICSNSTSLRLENMLKRVGLYELFAPNIFSAKEVGSGKTKPAPDVFLHAARHFGVDPANVLVIEDSVHGVHGARSRYARHRFYGRGAHLSRPCRQADRCGSRNGYPPPQGFAERDRRPVHLDRCLSTVRKENSDALNCRSGGRAFVAAFWRRIENGEQFFGLFFREADEQPGSHHGGHVCGRIEDSPGVRRFEDTFKFLFHRRRITQTSCHSFHMGSRI